MLIRWFAAPTGVRGVILQLDRIGQPPADGFPVLGIVARRGCPHPGGSYTTTDGVTAAPVSGTGGEVVQAHGVRYPWGEWFDRGCFTLRRGVDFAGSIPGMISTIRTAAKRHGLRVSVSAPGDVVTVRVRALGKKGKGGHRATHP